LEETGIDAVTPSPFDRLKSACQKDWQAYCHHDFVRQLGAGSLAPEAFRHDLNPRGLRR